jgi:hypothetical protein
MAVNKKGLREIIVNEELYYWKFSSEDDWDMHIIIISTQIEGSFLRANLRHHQYFGTGTKPPYPSIKPAMIREAIERALAIGWNPQVKGTFERTIDIKNELYNGE